MRAKLTRSSLLLLLAVLLFAFPGARIPVLDRHADQYFSDAIQKAGLAYATTRVLNASVSVIKNSEVRLEPGGVGLSIAAGQVVDPIDDMTERLSDVLVTAIASLGVQRLLHEISVSVMPYVLGLLLAVFAGVTWLKWRADKFREYLLGATAIIIVGRLCLPVSSLVNDFLYQNFFLDDIMKARQELSLASNELNKLREIDMPEIKGLGDILKNSALFLKSKTVAFKDTIIAVTDNTGNIVTSLLTLTWLYAGIFFVQVIALPIFMFWLLVKIANALLSTDLPVVWGRSENT